jgi:antitoxin (DNA-binding transcriptional repressor) of toxin-antitoxin stability system
MNNMTTTNLRKKSAQLVKTLKKGESVSLIHRSKVIGVIEPIKENRNVFVSTHSILI